MLTTHHKPKAPFRETSSCNLGDQFFAIGKTPDPIRIGLDRHPQTSPRIQGNSTTCENKSVVDRRGALLFEAHEYWCSSEYLSHLAGGVNMQDLVQDKHI